MTRQLPMPQCRCLWILAFCRAENAESHRQWKRDSENPCVAHGAPPSARVPVDWSEGRLARSGAPARGPPDGPGTHNLAFFAIFWTEAEKPSGTPASRQARRAGPHPFTTSGTEAGHGQKTIGSGNMTRQGPPIAYGFPPYNASEMQITIGNGNADRQLPMPPCRYLWIPA